MNYTFLLIQTERLYNRELDQLINLPCIEDSEIIIKKTGELYNKALRELECAGIGGVLINGTFRWTHKEERC